MEATKDGPLEKWSGGGGGWGISLVSWQEFFSRAIGYEGSGFFLPGEILCRKFFWQTLFSRLLIPVHHHMSANLQTSSSCHNYLITHPHQTLYFHMFTSYSDVANIRETPQRITGTGFSVQSVCIVFRTFWPFALAPLSLWNISLIVSVSFEALLRKIIPFKLFCSYSTEPPGKYHDCVET